MLWYKFTLYFKSLSNVFDSTFQDEHTGLENDKKKDIYSGFPPVYQERFKRAGFFHQKMVKRAGSRKTVKDLSKKHLKMER